MKITLAFVCTLSFLFSYAQHTNFNTQTNWALNKKELFIGGGITQFKGDLGGTNKWKSNQENAKHYWPSTSWNAKAGYRYRFHPYWATTSTVQIGQVRGSDALIRDDYRNARNLHFRASFIEVSQRAEVMLFVNERFGMRYYIGKIPRAYYWVYAYVGAGILLYNPQAHYNNTWIDLHPLRTEGQSLPGGPKRYQRVTASIPFGLGYRWQISRMWRMGLEIEYTFTFSDYLDDVGGVYYDSDQLAAEVGATSAYLSNPSTQNPEWFSAGQPRGNDKRDGFFSFGMHFSRNITYKYYGRKRPKSDSEPL